MGTNDWQTLATFSGYSGGAWGYPWIDLSPYASQKVQLGFYFESLNGTCNGSPVDVSSGW